jgi:hypothetical protein
MYPVRYELGFVSQKTAFFVTSARNCNYVVLLNKRVHFSSVIYRSSYLPVHRCPLDCA